MILDLNEPIAPEILRFLVLSQAVFGILAGLIFIFGPGIESGEYSFSSTVYNSFWISLGIGAIFESVFIAVFLIAFSGIAGDIGKLRSMVKSHLRNTISDPGRNPCPYCKEKILEEASICPFCRSAVGDSLNVECPT